MLQEKIFTLRGGTYDLYQGVVHMVCLCVYQC